MTRYIISRWTVTTDEGHARRAVEADGGTWGDWSGPVRQKAEGVEPVRVAKNLTLWSDGRSTDTPRRYNPETRIYEPEFPITEELSPDADGIVTGTRGADFGGVQGGGGQLFDLVRISERVTLEVGRTLYQHSPPRLEKWIVEFRDGHTETWYHFSEGYSDGYTYLIGKDLAHLRKEVGLDLPAIPEPAPDARRECWECGRTVTYREVKANGGQWSGDNPFAPDTCYCGC